MILHVFPSQLSLPHLAHIVLSMLFHQKNRKERGSSKVPQASLAPAFRDIKLSTIHFMLGKTPTLWMGARVFRAEQDLH